MEQKKTLVLVGVGAAILAVAFLFMNFNTANQKLAQEKNDLAKELNSLRKKNDSLIENNSRLESRARQLDEQLERMQREASSTRDLIQEKEELQRRYEAVLKEKNELVDRLSRAKPQVSEPSVARPSSISVSSASSLSDDLYWSGVLKEKTNLEVALSKVTDELKILRAKFDEQQRAKKSLESEITNLKEMEMKSLMNEKQDLERRLAYNERTIDSLSLELVREKKDNRKLKEDYKALESEKEALRNEIGSLRNEIGSLNDQIRSINNSKLALEDKLQKIELSRQDLERRVMAINALLDEKTSEIMDMKNRLELIKQDQGLIPKPQPSYSAPRYDTVQKPSSAVELPPIVVRSDANTSPAVTSQPRENKGITGRILEINKENKFVIIDIGDDQGIKPGTELGVYQGSRRIATLEVIQTRRSISAADIKQVMHAMRVGDTVKID